MISPYDYQLKHDQNGRIIEKTETVAGESLVWAYAYDAEGRLAEGTLNGRVVFQCDYDREGRRIRDRLPLTSGASFRNYEYRMDNRLMRAGDNRYTHDKSGFRSIHSLRGSYTTFKYAPDYRLLEVHQEDDDIRYTFDHDENGQRMLKQRNGQTVEAYKWLDFIRLAGFYDGEHVYEFAYPEGCRVPHAMARDDGSVWLLYYDQIGSLRVVADTNGNVIKEIAYDPFGCVIKDTAPALRIPIGFSGGLHDHDLGLVRFGWRDYDPVTARWTAPDPMGDAGGDSDWYGYCLDDPVNAIDPLGLAYSGGDFGSGYDGTSGSGYSGVGGNSTTDGGMAKGAGNGNDDGDTLDALSKGRLPNLDRKVANGLIGRGGIRDGAGEGSSAQNARNLSFWEKRQKQATPPDQIQELQRKEKERQRNLRAAEERRNSGLRLATPAAVGFGVGLLTANPILGGLAGFTTGLLAGTAQEGIEQSDLSEDQKKALKLGSGLALNPPTSKLEALHRALDYL